MENKNLLKLPELPNTIEECHDLIRSLFKTVTELCQRIERLEIENRELREKLNNNSSNSSLPPSRDFKKKKNIKPASKNKSGGQKGHKGHFRQLLKTKEVDTIINCHLPSQCSCGGEIKLKKEQHRHQVHELPVIKLHVTEYCLEKGCCTSCKSNYVANLPEGITWGITGPRLTGLMSHLVSRYKLSRRELKEFLQEQFQFSISIGTIFNKQKIVNSALEVPAAELLVAVKQSQSINADETSHNRDGKKQWMWGFCSSTVAFFSIYASRGKKVLKSLLGDFKNIVISDRYAAYNYFDSSCRQLCWAHLKRDFTKLSEKDNNIIARIGKNLLNAQAELFKVWHEFKQNHITRNELIRCATPIRKQIGELLEQGSYTDPILKVIRFSKNLLNNFDAMWTFLYIDDVEPTNNHGERCLRQSVIWRKKYFGTRSDYGTEFVARSASMPGR